MVERLEMMTESQVMDGLLEVRAARDVHKEELAERIKEMIQFEPRERPRAARAKGDIRELLAYLVSAQAFFNSVNKLRSRAGTGARFGGASLTFLDSAKSVKKRASFFDSLEDALNERLEWLRKRPSSDS